MNKLIPIEEVQQIANSVARRFHATVFFLTQEDLYGEILTKLLTVRHEGKPVPYLRVTAENFAKDLARKGRHRSHAELDQPISKSEDGESITFRELLENRSHPELIAKSAEMEFFRRDRRQRIQHYLALLPPRGREIISKRLNKTKLLPMERKWLSSFRKQLPLDLLEEIREILDE